MPVRIINTEYSDDFGNINTFAKFNAGDRVTLKLLIESSIKMSSITNPMPLDYTTLEVTSSSISWIDEGFRTGDDIRVTRYTQFGVVLSTYTTTVLYVDAQILKLQNEYSGWYLQTNQESITIEVINRNRESVEFRLNLVKNGIAGNEFSLIDGQATRFIYPMISILGIGFNTSAVLVGNQSGQALIYSEVLRLPNAGDAYVYEFEISFISTGFYDAEWFDSSGCLKPYVKMLWSSINNEPYAQTVKILNDNANTGFYDEFNNSTPSDSTFISGLITELDYSIPTNFSFVISGDLSQIGIGGAYISVDDTYYKNKIQSQQSLAMVAHTRNVFISPLLSDVNPLNAGYSIVINSFSSVGSNHTINATFIPNANFTSFIDSQEDGNRLFYLWVRGGNCNYLLFQEQLTTVPPTGGPLIMVDTIEFLDHSQNVVDNSISIPNDEIINLYDTEDDLAFFGRFKLEQYAVYDRLNIRIEGFNTGTNEDFILQQHSFSFNSVQISNDGKYLLDESLSINPLMPNTSFKINSLFKRDNSIDLGNEYGVSIYYPIVIRWEYWLQQLNASVDFYPNQNKNWQQYSQNGDWILRLKLELIKDGLAYNYEAEIIDFTYDNEAEITSTIELIHEIDNTIIDIIPIGEMMRIRATHTLINGIWDVNKTWGQIRVYPTENAPPWISSTTIAFDNNGSNPLSPIIGQFASLTFPSMETAVVECIFDTSKLNLSNGATITAKIKDLNKQSPLIQKTGRSKTFGEFIKTTSPISLNIKTVSS